MNKVKLYKTLGLKPGASPDEVRRSFRRLARRYHPDMNPSDPVDPWLNRISGFAQDTMLVGHLPFMGILAAALLGGLD